MSHTKIISISVATAAVGLLAAPAAADRVIVEFGSLDGTPLVAPGDARSTLSAWNPAATRKRVEARAAAIAAARAAFVASLANSPAGRVTGSYRHFPFVRMEVGEAGRAALAANPQVVAVHEDVLRRPLTQSSLAYIGASRWHAEGHVGDGTSVAVLDSGIRYWNGHFGTCGTAGAPGCRVTVFEGFATLAFGRGTTDPVEVAEAEPHGTNVGGIVGDVAPGTDLLSLGVFAIYEPNPSTGFEGGSAANDGDIVEALDWVIEHQVERNIVAANLSLGSDVDPDLHGYCTGWIAGSYGAAFANTRDAGVLPMVATGNDYVKTAVAPPACVAAAVRVGAGYDDPAYGYSCGTGPVVPGAVVCFSDSSSLVDLIAPGYDIDAGGLFGFSGTSMAAPHAAGVVAAYQARYATDPVWTLERIRADAVPVLEGFAGQPYVHRYVRLGDRDAVVHFDTGVVLASDFAGVFVPDGNPAGIDVTANVVCETDMCASDTVGQVFLDLTVQHDATGDLVIELEAPDGTVARHEVADDAEFGKYNVNSILGSQHLPDVFDGLEGASIEGTWRLRVADDAAGNSGRLHRAVLMIDSARAAIRAAVEAPAIVRPGVPFEVSVTLTNTGNLDITGAPLTLEFDRAADGTVAASAPVAADLPMRPGDRVSRAASLTWDEQGDFELRVTTPGLTPDLAPGLDSDVVPVRVTERTFASFGVDPRVPAPAEEAALLDWSVGLIDTYAWDFGDGTVSTEAEPVHVWASEGEYVVSLTVTGPDGTSTAARRVLVEAPPTYEMSPAGGGCECGVARPASGAAGVAFALLVLAGAFAFRRRRESVRPGATLGLALAVLGALSCDDEGPGAGDGGDADGYRPGPWVSFLGPADPVEGDVDLYLRVGQEDSRPCDLRIEYRVGEGEFRAATLEDPSAATGVSTAPLAGVEHVLRWLSTTDLPGDTGDVQLRVVASDGEIESAPVSSAPFRLLNFFVTHPHAVLITEVSTADNNVPGTVVDDYVEILNTTSDELSLDGWTLAITSSSGARDEFPLDGAVLPAGGRLALVEDGAHYGGGRPLPRELPWGVEGYGSAAVVATFGRGVDFVRWGGSPEPPPRGNGWVDDAPLPVPQTLTALVRDDETADTDAAADFCVGRPTPDEAGSDCLPRLERGDVLVTELDSQGTDDQVEVLNRSGGPVDVGGWVLLWNGGDLGSGVVPLASHHIADGERLGLRDNGMAGRVSGSIMELGVNLNIDGLVPTAVGLKDPYGEVIDFLAAGGSTIRWLDWVEVEPTPMPGPQTTLSRRPGDPDTDSAADFCLTTPNVGAAPDGCLEPVGAILGISEVMPGRPDWVEIHNPGPEPVDLSQVYLSYTAPYYGGSVEDFRLAGTLAPGALVVVSERDLPGVSGEILVSENISLSSEGAGSVAVRDVNGFGIDFVMWGEPAGTPLWPDVWSGLGADPYPVDSDAMSIERHPHDATDTDRRDDWCWAVPSPGAPNNPCE